MIKFSLQFSNTLEDDWTTRSEPQSGIFFYLFLYLSGLDFFFLVLPKLCTIWGEAKPNKLLNEEKRANTKLQQNKEEKSEHENHESKKKNHCIDNNNWIFLKLVGLHFQLAE